MEDRPAPHAHPAPFPLLGNADVQSNPSPQVGAGKSYALTLRTGGKSISPATSGGCHFRGMSLSSVFSLNDADVNDEKLRASMEIPLSPIGHGTLFPQDCGAIFDFPAL